MQTLVVIVVTVAVLSAFVGLTVAVQFPRES
jgi:hypothetical protein